MKIRDEFSLAAAWILQQGREILPENEILSNIYNIYKKYYQRMKKKSSSLIWDSILPVNLT